MNNNTAESGFLEIRLRAKMEDDYPVYIAGNFNAWKMPDPSYKLEFDGKQEYRISIEKSKLSFPVYFRFARGSWDSVELDEYGNKPLERKATQQDQLIEATVERWAKNGLTYNPDYLPKIEVISNDFEIPQLGKKRRISILLPCDYDQSDKRYPVMYLHDGQNLFDEAAPFGNWGVDKKMAVLKERGHPGLIVVAIDHGGTDRIKEFTPFQPSHWGPGDGKKYVRFLADTLKPHIDQQYRTLPDRENTGVGGSSMGGLISIYAGLMYPEEFGKLLIFSPSLWVSPKIYSRAIHFYSPFNTDIYMYAGEKESNFMVPNVKRLIAALEQKGIDTKELNFNLRIDPEGQHNEATWGAEFPRAAEWLFPHNP